MPFDKAEKRRCYQLIHLAKGIASEISRNQNTCNWAITFHISNTTFCVLKYMLYDGS